MACLILLCWVAIAIWFIIGGIPLGVLFLFGAFNVFYCGIVGVQSKLNNWGVLFLVLGLFTSILSGLQLFVNINVMQILFR